jgi:hypothetical protein
MLNVFREEAAEQMALHMCFGVVLEDYKEKGKLKVRADGHDLDGDDLLVADYLHPEYSETKTLKETGRGKLSGNAECAKGGKHSEFEISGVMTPFSVTVQNESRLKKGDMVLLIPDTERQLYAVVCKVVSP